MVSGGGGCGEAWWLVNGGVAVRPDGDGVGGGRWLGGGRGRGKVVIDRCCNYSQTASPYAYIYTTYRYGVKVRHRNNIT